MKNEPKRILMVDPRFYDVIYDINPHMTGKLGTVDKKRAREEWESLKGAYETIGFPVVVLEPKKNLPDMVFAANQSFPFLDRNGKKKVILSNMATKERAPEVAFFADWYRQQGYEVIHLKTQNPFEGMGDLLVHPNRDWLWGGFGFRTKKEVYGEIEKIVQKSVHLLELMDNRFYHLDTCLSILDETTALYYPKAFDPNGIQLLEENFETLIEVSAKEALNGFACNAHSPDGKHILIQKGNERVKRELIKKGFDVMELETSEFLKSGGSVFCLKMMIG